MPEFVLKVLPVVAAGAVALAVYLLVDRFVLAGPRASKRLGDFVGTAAQVSGKSVKYGSHANTRCGWPFSPLGWT
jgi:hypothetical protein